MAQRIKGAVALLASALALGMAPAAAADLAAGAAAGARVWAKCSACHSVQAGAQGMLGPNLHNVLGRKAGTAEGYKYSPALQNANLVWDAAALDAFIKSPMEKVPGNRMAFAGVKDAKDRAELLRFLSGKTP